MIVYQKRSDGGFDKHGGIEPGGKMKSSRYIWA